MKNGKVKQAQENKFNIYRGWPKETKTFFSDVGRVMTSTSSKLKEGFNMIPMLLFFC